MITLNSQESALAAEESAWEKKMAALRPVIQLPCPFTLQFPLHCTLPRPCPDNVSMHRQPAVKAGSVQMNGAAVEATEDEEVYAYCFVAINFESDTQGSADGGWRKWIRRFFGAQQSQWQWAGLIDDTSLLCKPNPFLHSLTHASCVCYNMNSIFCGYCELLNPLSFYDSCAGWLCAGATTSSICSLCRPGTNQTNSGWATLEAQCFDIIELDVFVLSISWFL